MKANNRIKNELIESEKHYRRTCGAPPLCKECNEKHYIPRLCGKIKDCGLSFIERS